MKVWNLPEAPSARSKVASRPWGLETIPHWTWEGLAKAETLALLPYQSLKSRGPGLKILSKNLAYPRGMFGNTMNITFVVNVLLFLLFSSVEVIDTSQFEGFLNLPFDDTAPVPT